jgi:sulfopyruvate decarboxylase subunit alpha
MSNSSRDAFSASSDTSRHRQFCTIARQPTTAVKGLLSTSKPAVVKFAAKAVDSTRLPGRRHGLSGVLATQADAHRPSDVLNTLKRLGFGAVVSVPDGWLGKILVRIEHEPTMRLVRATHEEEALAIACGIRLGGIRTALLVQNAGVLSMGAGMVSLAQRYQFPLLMLVSYRGTADDPVFYHVPKGRATEPVLRGIGLNYAVVDRHRPIGPQVEHAATYAEEASCPFALLLSREDIQW